MELLTRVEDRGFPLDYLLSRIRGKRACLVSDWNNMMFSGNALEYLASSSYRGFVKATSPEGLRRDLMKEYRWIYLRLNRALLGVLSPFFLYCELRTIYICLRHIKDGATSRTGQVLFDSLLSDEMKDIFGKGSDVSSTVREIEKVFLGLSKTFEGVGEVFDHEGLRGFERELTVRYLVMAAGDRLHPLMKDFFVRIIDARNIISLYKFIRLRPGSVPAFIPLGSISDTVFTEIIEQNDDMRLYRLAGLRDEGPSHLTIEGTLYRNMTIFLKKAGRDPLGVAQVLDYLWRCSIEAMNLRVLSYGADIPKEKVSMELVN